MNSKVKAINVLRVCAMKELIAISDVIFVGYHRCFHHQYFAKMTLVPQTEWICKNN